MSATTITDESFDLLRKRVLRLWKEPDRIASPAHRNKKTFTYFLQWLFEMEWHRAPLISHKLQRKGLSLTLRTLIFQYSSAREPLLLSADSWTIIICILACLDSFNASLIGRRLAKGKLVSSMLRSWTYLWSRNCKASTRSLAVLCIQIRYWKSWLAFWTALGHTIP